MEIYKLQKEMYDWKVNNFGGVVKNGHQNLLGVIEEIGELSHSVLKKQQLIRINERHDEKIKDSIGDIFIFLMNYLSEKGIEFKMPKMFYDSSICNERDEVNIMDIFITANELVKIQFSIENLETVPKGNNFLLINSQLLVKKLMYFCCCNNWKFEKIINETWEQVKLRDWNKNKVDGVQYAQ